MELGYTVVTCDNPFNVTVNMGQRLHIQNPTGGSHNMLPSASYGNPGTYQFSSASTGVVGTSGTIKLQNPPDIGISLQNVQVSFSGSQMSVSGNIVNSNNFPVKDLYVYWHVTDSSGNYLTSWTRYGGSDGQAYSAQIASQSTGTFSETVCCVPSSGASAATPYIVQAFRDDGTKLISINNPPTDTDGDGISDSSDSCPTQPETLNDYQDTDGCPDTNPATTDTDGDGISDSIDQCLTQKETVNGFADLDGCPDIVPQTDTDKDGILDSLDSCPTQKETVNGYQDTDGCPDVVPSTYADAVTVEMAKGSSSNTSCDDECYTPSTVQIKTGGTVTWKNADTAAHTVTSGKDATSDGLFDSGMITVGSSFNYKFDKTGTYDYYCMVHPWMKGIILVGGGNISPTDAGEIRISSTKSEYSPGESILVLGSANPYSLLTLTLNDSNGNILKTKQITLDKNGKFSDETFRIPNNAKSGVWQIKAQSGTNFSITKFTVGGFDDNTAQTITLPVTVGDKKFTVTSKTIGVSITKISADLDFMSLILDVTTTGNPGIIEIIFDRSFFDSVYQENDDTFIVLADGHEPKFSEIETTPQSRTLSIELPAGTQEVEIIGSQLGSSTSNPIKTPTPVEEPIPTTEDLPYEIKITPTPGSSSPGCETSADGCFIPTYASVATSGKVIFSNTDTAAHTFTAGTAADGPSGEFDSSLVVAGSSYEWKPTTEGEFPYYCMVHPWMSGIIFVGKSPYPIPEPTPEPISLNLVIDPTVYDIGNTVSLKISLDGVSSPHDVGIDISDVTGKTIISRSVTTTSSGEAGIDIKIAENFKAGTYHVVATTSVDGKTITGSTQFIVKSQYNQFKITSVESTNQQGSPAPLKAGELGFIKVNLESNKSITTLVTVNLFDSDLTSIGIGSVKTTLSSGNSEIILSFMIPKDAALGPADIYVNAFSDWPSNNGIPLTKEFAIQENIQ